MRIILVLLAALCLIAPQGGEAAPRRRARAGSSKKSAKRASSTKKRSAASQKRAAKTSGNPSLGAAGGESAADGDRAAMPTGAVIVWSSSKPPNGWIWADGSAIPQDERFSRLRDLVGDKVPDMRGAFADKQPFSLNYIIKY